MHIEIDVLEISFLIVVVYAVKWIFRLLVLMFVGKIVAQIKQKGEEKVNGFVRGFGQAKQSQKDDREQTKTN